MSDKDFLSQLVSDEKPESFKEEERIKISETKKPFNLKVFLAIFLPLISGIALLLFLFLSPKIKMLDFVGKNKNELLNFLRQQEIDFNGVIINEEYSLEYDKDIVIYQSVVSNKKISKKEKLNFTVSKGADPDESINLPDLKSMNKTQINNWISENKLSGTKVNIVYDDNVADGEIIKYELKGEESEFKRNTQLTITISKGKAPAGKVVVPEFKGKNVDDYSEELKKKKLNTQTVGVYDDKIVENQVVSINAEVGKSVDEGATIIINYSKGKAVIVPDFTKMSKEEYNKKKNEFNIIENTIYSESNKFILNQSVNSGSKIGVRDLISLTINSGKPKISEFAENGLVGVNIHDVYDWINNVNAKSDNYDLAAGEWGNSRIYSKDYEKDMIISYSCHIYESGKSVDCHRPLEKHTRISVVVSAGKIYPFATKDKNGIAVGVDEFMNFLSTSKIYFTTGEGSKIETSDINVIKHNDEVIYENGSWKIENIEIKQEDIIRFIR